MGYGPFLPYNVLTLSLSHPPTTPGLKFLLFLASPPSPIDSLVVRRVFYILARPIR